MFKISIICLLNMHTIKTCWLRTSDESIRIINVIISVVNRDKCYLIRDL